MGEGMKTITALLLALASFSASASDRIMVDTYTGHSSYCQDSYSAICEPWKQPRRLSWQHDLSRDLSTDIGLGTNSYGKESASAGLLYLPFHLGAVQAGAFAAVVSGYTCDQLKTCMLAAGEAVSVKMGSAVMQVLYVPAIGGGTVSVVQLRVGMEF
jgi:hypothetical protein